MKLQHYGGLRVNKMKKNKVTIVLVGIIAILAISLAVTFAVTRSNSKKRQSGFYYINHEGEVVSDVFDRDTYLDTFDKYGIAKIMKKSGGNTILDDEIYFIDTDFNVIGNRVFTYDNAIEWEYDNKVYFLCREGTDFQILDSNMNVVSSIDNYFSDDSKLTAYVSHGLAKGWIPIRSKESNYEKMGYIDINCNYVIEPKYCYCREFSDDGLAMACEELNKKGVIDEKGEYVIAPKYYQISNFSHGVAMAQETENGEARLIDRSGNIISKESYEYMYDFVDDLFSEKYVYASEYGNSKIGFIDETGNFVIELDKRKGNFSGGYAYVEDKNGKFGFIDENGNLVIPYQYDSAGDFTEDGIAPVKVGSLWGYIRTDNTWVLEPQFEEVSFFKNGYAYIWLNEDQQIKPMLTNME